MTGSAASDVVDRGMLEGVARHGRLSRRRHPRIPLSTRLLGLGTVLAGWSIPSLGAALAYRLWFRTVRPAETEAAFEILQRARHRELSVGDTRVMVYSWGDGPTALLVHGWGSHAGRMTPFVDPLLQRGFRVVAPDLPGHGRAPGRRTDIFQLRDALLAVARRSGPVNAVVAHSLGALATLTACRSGITANAGVLVSPAIDMGALVGTFQRRVSLPAAAIRRLEPRLRDFVGDGFYRGLLKHGPARTLVIHDTDDDEIPYEVGRMTAERLLDARLMTTEGLGHNRVLQDPTVVSEAVAFLARWSSASTMS